MSRPPGPAAGDDHDAAAGGGGREEAVATFRAVTAVSSDDEAAAMLRAAAWDLPRAVDAFLSGAVTSGDDAAAAMAAATTRTRTASGNSSSHDASEAGRRGRAGESAGDGDGGDAGDRGGWGGDGADSAHRHQHHHHHRHHQHHHGRHLAIALPRNPPRWLIVLFAPFRFVWSAVVRVADAVLAVLGGSARAIDVSPGNTPARRFRAFYEARHGPLHPAFFDGSYLAALADAQARLKFLLVYLHSEEHSLTRELCARVLAHPHVVRAIDEDFVFWAGSVTQSEGAAAQHALRVSGFPFLGVVAPPRATVRVPSAPSNAANVRHHFRPQVSSHNFGTLLSCRVGPGSLTGVPLVSRAESREHAARSNGMASAALVAPSVQPSGESGADGAVAPSPLAISTVNWLAAVQRENAGLLDQVRHEREQRDSARLLRQEQDREFARSLEEDRARERAREEAEERARVESARVRERETARERKCASMAAEPKKGPGIASIVLRLPGGERASRRFDKNAPLEQVFDWAEVNHVDIELACLVSSYPRKSFRYPEDAHLTLQEAGFFPSAMLLLEERPEEET